MRSPDGAQTFGERLLTNHPLVNILFTVVLLMGVLSYISMPREQDPEINFNWVNINTSLPGASAQDVEELVTGPLEDAIRVVQDIKFVSSASREGDSNILVRFRDLSDREFDKRVTDLRREIQNKAADELPEEAEDPRILEITTSNGFPTALVVVVGQADDERLRRTARLIKDDLERISGVDKVNAFGLHDPELHVRLDPTAMAARGLTAIDVADALRTGFRDVFAGTTGVGEDEWLVRVESTTADPEELAAFQVAPRAVPDRRVSLDTIASIERAREDPYQLIAFEGQPAVSLGVTKVRYTNTIELVERVRDYIETRNQTLEGSGLRVVLADDQTVPTREAITIMQTNAMLGLFLVLCVCWLFLGIRIAAMVTLGIAFSIAGAFWMLNVTGNTVNVSVLLGIVIVLGMLVDDAVVIVEALFYRIQRGAEALPAAVDALREVGTPVASAVMTTMAAFLPLMLLPGIVGKFMFVIPFVVTVGLLVSLVEAFWILPSHVIALNPKAPGRVDGERVSHRVVGWRNRWTHWVRVKYTKALIRVMRHPKMMLSGAVLAFVMAGLAVGAGVIRMEFFTFDPLRIFYVNVDMPPDSPLENTLEQAVRVEERVRGFVNPEEVRAITAQAGLKFTDVDIQYGDQFAQIQVALNPRGRNGRTVSEIVDEMRDTVVATPGDADISFFEVSGGPPTSAPISVKVRADDFDELERAMEAVKDIVREIPGSYDVTDNLLEGRAELVLDLDYRAIRRAGLDPGTVARLLRLHQDGEVVAFFRDEGEKVELRVLGQGEDVQAIEAVLDDPIALADGSTTTFRALADWRIDRGRGTIRHHNLRRAITVEAEIDTELNDTVSANEELQDRWSEVRAAYPTADLDFSGELDDINESLDAMAGLFLLGLGLIYLILATEFRSYFQPLLVLVTVPMAFTGVVTGLAVTNNPLSLYTLYGVIALTGIAVNAAIVLIAAANQRIAAGMRPLHATVYAARRRVVPILMTTTTTIAGLFSLAVGLGGKSLLWGPVATSIVAGLFVASGLTLFVVPTLYRIFMRGHGLAVEETGRSDQDLSALDGPPAR